jgi:ribosomal protein S18 acetylase RimI-like enzyme
MFGGGSTTVMRSESVSAEVFLGTGTTFLAVNDEFERRGIALELIATFVEDAASAWYGDKLALGQYRG